MSTKVLLEPMEGYLKLRLFWPPVTMPAWRAHAPGSAETAGDSKVVRTAAAADDSMARFVTGAQAAAFANLKQRLLLRALDDVDDHVKHNLIINQANTAAHLASATGYPLLVFPCLFQERASEALIHDHRRRSAYWRGLA